MCGIVGYIGKKNCLPILIDGLKSLEYRGYDSAGVAYFSSNKVNIVKEKGKLANLEKIINKEIYSNIGIGHTRWATHGEPNQINSHPHQMGSITLVHNGIIENYEEIRTKLKTEGYVFKTDTDTEVAAAMIDFLYRKNNDILFALNEIKNIFRGSYALGILVDEDNTLYAVKKNSPLIIGLGDEGNFIASDVPAILKYTNKYLLLNDNEYAKLEFNKVSIYSDMKEITKDIKTFDFSIEQAMKCGYDHFMLKEINEEDILTKNLIDLYLRDKKTLLNKIPDFRKYKRIDIVACGSAYHAGLIGKILVEVYGNIPVNVEIASEYRYKKLFLDNKTLVIAISQSGETADTLASIRIAKEHKADTLGIVNAVGSSIARECDNTLYINAGCEIAVATTKAYAMQVLMLSFIAFSMGIRNKNISDKDCEEIIARYKLLPSYIRLQINKNYKTIAKKIYNKKDIFFIGRNIDYALSMEGSLKLKEISYIHSESYAAGELKHGTISLIEDGTPVVAIVTDKKIMEKTISNIKEVKARGVNVLLIINEELNFEGDFYDEKIVIGNLHKLIDALITIVPLQLLAYEIAKLKGCDIDKPRNLAKSVTVE